MEYPQVSVAQLYNDLSLKKTEQILNDSTHLLHQKATGQMADSCKGKLGPLGTASILCLQQLDCPTTDLKTHMHFKLLAYCIND